MEALVHLPNKIQLDFKLLNFIKKHATGFIKNV